MRKIFLFVATTLVALVANAAVININNTTPDALRLALNDANNGDEIVMAAGTYVESNDNYIAFAGKNVTVKAAEGASVLIQPQVPIQITEGGTAHFVNVKFDASRLQELADWYEHLIYPADAADNNAIILDGCEFYGFNFNKSMIYCSSSNKLAAISINNCYFHDCMKSILFDENTSVAINAQVTNSTFANISTNTESYWAGIIDLRATGANLLVDHCTFYNVIPMNTDYSCVSKINLANGVTSNCIFMLPTAQDGIRAMRGVTATNCITYNYLKDSGTGIHSSVTQTNCVQADPLFVDAANGNFKLGEGSPALTLNNGEAIGDPRWNATAPVVTPQYEVAEAIAAGLTDDDEIMVRGIITKMEFKGKNFAKYGSVNIYVKDATGAEGEFEFFNCYSLEADTFKASVPAYDATSTAWAEFKEVSDGNGVAVHVGDTVIAFGKYKLYNTTYELNTGCYLVDIKHAAETPVEGDTIDVTINAITTPGALVWTDAVASAGWWQIMGTTEDYEFSLSNVSTTEVAGVYAIADLDPDYSYITVMTATDTTDVTFVDGSVTVAVANDGTVTIVGALVGDDGNVYNFNLTYVDPKAERVANVTISKGTLYDGYASAGLYAVYGTADDNTAYVQLAIWAEAGFEGEFTEEDLDFQYVGSGVQDADGSHSIFSAAITVTPGDGEGVYSITADLLCYNNTLYKVSMSIGKTEGFESVDAAVKAIKCLVNGNVVIEKAGKRYNVNGARL